jgi:hypothetical protein
MAEEIGKMRTSILTRKMNKKGIFYSLSVLLFLIFLVIVFNNKSQVLKKDEQFHVDRAKVIVTEHFVRDFDRYYAYHILETAARPALINLTRQNSPSASSTADIIALMRDGVSVSGNTHMNPLLTTGENFNQSLATLSFQLDQRDFTYELVSAKQLDYHTVMLNFHVNYSFGAFDTNWSMIAKDVNITIPVYGLWHPGYDQIIASDWIENNTGICYVNQIISPAPDPGCTGMNIRPAPFCGDGSVNQASEQCDPPDGVDCDAVCQIIPTP